MLSANQRKHARAMDSIQSRLMAAKNSEAKAAANGQANSQKLGTNQETS
tara:strand:- start:151 stop:297 length:147 start_codon:yes stop_codon:yes gene_type:complete